MFFSSFFKQRTSRNGASKTSHLPESAQSFSETWLNTRLGGAIEWNMMLQKFLCSWNVSMAGGVLGTWGFCCHPSVDLTCAKRWANMTVMEAICLVRCAMWAFVKEKATYEFQNQFQKYSFRITILTCDTSYSQCELSRSQPNCTYLRLLLRTSYDMTACLFHLHLHFDITHVCMDSIMPTIST